MTDSSTTSRDFAPSWLRTSNHSPTPPLRTSANSGASRDDWERSGSERKLSGSSRSQWGTALNGDSQSENYFQYNGRISDYLDSHGDFFRRSNSIGVNSNAKNNTLLNRNYNNASDYRHQQPHHDMWNDRPKHDHNHYRNGNASFSKGYASRDSQANSNGISYSFVTTKGLKPGTGSSVVGPTSPPALQPSDFPSLSTMKSEPAKSAQNTVWGNPPHLAKVMKRSLSSQNYLEEGGGTILGPHYGKGFFPADFRRDLKDELDALNSGSGDGIGVDEYAKSEYANGSTGSEDSESHHEHQEALTDQQHDMESNSMHEHEVDWTISEIPRREHQTVEPSMLSSTGSTGSVESIDSHHSNLSGGALMVDDLLDEIISEEEKSRVFHALEEIKERTGSVSYYERVALRPDSDVTAQNRLKGFPDVKVEDADEEDPDDRLLK